METTYYILLSLKTQQGFTNYGQYFLGDNRETAYQLFDQLKGNKDISDKAMLHIDLMETINELPIKIKTLCCTLDELGENCKLIAREIFRLKSIKEMV